MQKELWIICRHMQHWSNDTEDRQTKQKGSMQKTKKVSSTDPTKILGINQGGRERLVALVLNHTLVVLLVVKSIIIVSTNQTDYSDESF